jgi:hypothetical protein
VARRDRLEFSLVWNLTNPACTTRTIGCAPIIHFEKNAARTISLPINLGSYFFRFFRVADPDPPDPYVFGPPGSGSISQRYGSGFGFGSGSFYHHAKIVRKTLIPTIM